MKEPSVGKIADGWTWGPLYGNGAWGWCREFKVRDGMAWVSVDFKDGQWGVSAGDMDGDSDFTYADGPEDGFEIAGRFLASFKPMKVEAGDIAINFRRTVGDSRE